MPRLNESNLQNRFALALWRENRIKLDLEGGFRLKLHQQFPRAPLSPVLMNLGDPSREILELAARLIYEEMNGAGEGDPWDIRYDGIAGVPSGGDPFARALAELSFGTSSSEKRETSSLRIITLGKSVRRGKSRVTHISDHGSCNRGDVILLVEDVLSAGFSSIEAIEVLRGEGLKVNDMVAVIDRQHGGRERLMAESNCVSHGLFPMISILDICLMAGTLDESSHTAICERLDELNSWLRDQRAGSP